MSGNSIILDLVFQMCTFTSGISPHYGATVSRAKLSQALRFFSKAVRQNSERRACVRGYTAPSMVDSLFLRSYQGNNTLTRMLVTEQQQKRNVFHGMVAWWGLTLANGASTLSTIVQPLSFTSGDLGCRFLPATDRAGLYPYAHHTTASGLCSSLERVRAWALSLADYSVPRV